MLSIFFSAIAHSQTINDNALKVENIYSNISYSNPSYNGTTGKAEVFLFYKSYSGSLSQLKTLYTQINYNIKDKEDASVNRKQTLGAFLFTEKEGEYFSRNRFNISYCWHGRVSENYELSAGISVVYISYVFTNSSGGAGGADNTFSSNIGICLNSPTFTIGLAVQDFNSPSLRPLNYQFRFNRYYVANLGKKFILNEKLRLDLLSTSYWNSKFMMNNSASFLISDHVSIGTFFHTYLGWSAMAGIKDVEFLSGELNFLFAYKLPVKSSSNLITNSYEFSLVYLFGREN